jgi:ATP/maltotriose-dependent transcriptional regulator MalT/DNA-binding SARP family transcriptional activator
VERLTRGFDAGAVLLVAEAGFGKTMALEEALEASGHTAVWVRCGPAARDPGQLLLDLIDAVRRAVPGAADVIAESLAAADVAPDGHAGSQALLRELESLLVEPLVAVFDDAEQLEPSPGALELVAGLMRAHAERVRFAVASRRPLPLKLAKLRASGRLDSLGPAELVFSAGECAALLELRHGRAPSPSEVESVMTTTEGWPLGVALSALAEPGSGTEPTRPELFEYLAEEVLEQLEPEEHDALLDSSLPRELTADLAAALSLPDGFMERVEGQGLFLRPVDPERRRYRYHPLFREFLLRRFRARPDPGERRRLHARLAAALTAAARREEAIEHWLEAAAFEEALQLLYGEREELMRSAPSSVGAWLQVLRAELGDDPRALLLEGQLSWAAGDHEPALEPLRAACSGFREAHDPEGEWNARLVLVDAVAMAEGPQGVVELAKGFDAPEASEVAAAPMAAMHAAWALADLGRMDESRALALRALDHPAAGAAAAAALEEERVLVYEDYPAGRFERAIERARTSVGELERAGALTQLGFVTFTLGAAYMEAGFADDALSWLRQTQEIGERAGMGGYTAGEAARLIAQLHVLAGRAEEAEAELARAGEAAATSWSRGSDEATRAAIAAQRGQAREALAAAERALALLAAAPLPDRVLVAAQLVPVLAEAGQTAKARAVLDEGLELCDRSWPGEQGAFFRARLLTLRAWLDRGEGQRSDAGRALSRAWAEAGEAREHLVRREWPRLRPLLWDALGDGAVDRESAMEAIQRAWPDGSELAAFMEHPVAAVRRSALLPAASSGHPEALSRLKHLVEDEDRGVRAAAAAAADSLGRDPPALSFAVLGGFRVRRGRWEVDDASWRRPMASRLVRFLLVSRESFVPEDVLFEIFWPDKPVETARRGLAVVLSLARGVLDPPGARESAIEVNERAFQLRLRARDRVDADEFVAASEVALAEEGPRTRPLLERAESIWTGEPLPEDRYADWSLAWREELLDRYLQVLAALAGVCSLAGDHTQAVVAGRKCLEIDPLNEGVHRALMAAYARSGRTSHALRQYLACRRALVDELGVEPAQATSRLHARILAGESV